MYYAHSLSVWCVQSCLLSFAATSPDPGIAKSQENISPLLYVHHYIWCYNTTILFRCADNSNYWQALNVHVSTGHVSHKSCLLWKIMITHSQHLFVLHLQFATLLSLCVCLLIPLLHLIVQLTQNKQWVYNILATLDLWFQGDSPLLSVVEPCFVFI